jgi:SOS response regulatory protein OraA/RecX
MQADSSNKLMRSAGSLLARRAYSRGELKDKLAPLGEAQEIESVLDRLEQLNLLNDADYAYNSASRWIRKKGWGPLRVYQLLINRKVPAHLAEETIAQVRQEISDVDALKAFLGRRFRTHSLPEDRKGIRKLISSLQREGFPEEVIWTVLRQKIPPGAWRDFDTGD